MTQEFTTGIERRAAPRIPVRTEVRIHYPHLRHLVAEICRDISVSGMFIESAAPPGVGTAIRFDLHIPTRRPQTVHGEAIVAWSDPNGDPPGRPSGFGVRFTQMDPRFQQLIFRVVDRYIQQGGDPFDLEAEGETRPGLSTTTG
jgi:uncharacterized protein (TIGR02266 family)